MTFLPFSRLNTGHVSWIAWPTLHTLSHSFQSPNYVAHLIGVVDTLKFRADTVASLIFLYGIEIFLLCSFTLNASINQLLTLKNWTNFDDFNYADLHMFHIRYNIVSTYTLQYCFETTNKKIINHINDTILETRQCKWDIRDDFQINAIMLKWNQCTNDNFG